MVYDEFDAQNRAAAIAASIQPPALADVLGVLNAAAAAQDSTVGNIRGRAAAVVSSAAIVVALGTTLGLVKIGPSGTGVQLDPYAGTLLLLITLAIGVLTTLVQWPQAWVFSSGTNVYQNVPLEAGQRAAITVLEWGLERNTFKIGRLLRLFNWSVVLLGLLVLVSLGDVLIHLIFKF